MSKRVFIEVKHVPTGKEKSLLAQLRKCITYDVAKYIIVPFLDKSCAVSLRLLDWTVVNWTKRHNVLCMTTCGTRMVSINHAYRHALAFWKRRMFGPFRRRQRVNLCVDGTAYETTLAQLNFLQWFFYNGIYYI